jgi:glycosyltransferase involved in cell wall biosynthesis
MKSMVEDSHVIQDRVEFVVCDNASTDGTAKFLQNFDSGVMRFRWFSQRENLGLDGNMRFLYKNSEAEYVWFFSDDDVLFPQAVGRILRALIKYLPVALLFSFVQPVGSTRRTFSYPEDVAVITDPREIIELLALYPKLSIYVYKKIELSKIELCELSQFFGTNYDFIALGYSLLQKTSAPKLCVISEPLAGCDEDFSAIRFSPETWGNAWIVFKHPYVKMISPGLEGIKRKQAYYDQIQALVAVKAGVLTVPDIGVYDRFIKTIEFQWCWLFQRPRSLGQICFLKLGLITFWMRYFSRIK